MCLRIRPAAPCQFYNNKQMEIHVRNRLLLTTGLCGLFMALAGHPVQAAPDCDTPGLSQGGNGACPSDANEAAPEHDPGRSPGDGDGDGDCDPKGNAVT